MARQWACDTDAGMTGFWRRGYAASSLAMPETASGLGRGSLYADLGRDEQHVMASSLPVLCNATDPISGLEGIFRTVSNRCSASHFS